MTTDDILKSFEAMSCKTKLSVVAGAAAYLLLMVALVFISKDAARKVNERNK
jgi:hypothetical protein